MQVGHYFKQAMTMIDMLFGDADKRILRQWRKRAAFSEVSETLERFRLAGARDRVDTCTTACSYLDAVLRRTLVALEAVGVQRVLAHTEKGVVYMAERPHAHRRPADVLFRAQSVGAPRTHGGNICRMHIWRAVRWCR